MAFTDTEICNMALSHIQSKSISNFDTDTGEEGEKCRLFYNLARQDTLSRFDWNFARQSTVLPVDAQDPDNTRYAYQYLRPADAISIRKLTHSSDESALIDYDQGLKVNPSGGAEQQVIYCDFENPLCTFTRDIKSNALFSPSFVVAFSYRLAMELCTALNLNERKTQVTQLFVATLQDAQVDDGNQFRSENTHVDLADELTGASVLNPYSPIIS
jgi:hypothetical protein